MLHVTMIIRWVLYGVRRQTCMEKCGRLCWYPKWHLDKIPGPTLARSNGGRAGSVFLLVHNHAHG